MKASERLRELDGAMNERSSILGAMNYYFGPGARTAVSRESVLQYEAAAKIIRALPLIADVVEAAEACDPGGPGWFGDNAEGDRIAAALTALRDALQPEIHVIPGPPGSGRHSMWTEGDTK